MSDEQSTPIPGGCLLFGFCISLSALAGSVIGFAGGWVAGHQLYPRDGLGVAHALYVLLGLVIGGIVGALGGVLGALWLRRHAANRDDATEV